MRRGRLAALLIVLSGLSSSSSSTSSPASLQVQQRQQQAQQRHGQEQRAIHHRFAAAASYPLLVTSHFLEGALIPPLANGEGYVGDAGLNKQQRDDQFQQMETEKEQQLHTIIATSATSDIENMSPLCCCCFLRGRDVASGGGRGEQQHGALGP